MDGNFQNSVPQWPSLPPPQPNAQSAAEWQLQQAWSGASPPPIHWITAQFGGKFVSTATVAFYENGFLVTGKVFWPWWQQLLVMLPLFLLGIIPGLVMLVCSYYFCRKPAADFIPYANIMKVKRKLCRVDFVAKNSEGREARYEIQYALQFAPFMDWVIDNRFPKDDYFAA